MSELLLIVFFTPMCVVLAAALAWHWQQQREYKAKLKRDAELRELMERWYAAEAEDAVTGGDAARLAVCRSVAQTSTV